MSGREKISIKERGESLRGYYDNLRKFLNPPYTFELPPTDRKLQIGDPGYDHYMCRSALIFGPAMAIDLLLHDPEIDLPEEVRNKLEDARDIMQQMIPEDRKLVNRTKKDMAIIKIETEEAVKVLENFLKREGVL